MDPSSGPLKPLVSPFVMAGPQHSALELDEMAVEVVSVLAAETYMD